MKKTGSSSGGGAAKSRKPAVRSKPPPFLKKTYEIVDDPNTNSIVKWGKFGKSIIILDHITFSVEILPKYFNHNIFANFTRQLNKYGFRKAGADHQWEYMSPDFQQGKQHLLSNMRRRSDQDPNANTQRIRQKKRNPNAEMVIEAINEAKLEMKKLKMQQMRMDSHIMQLHEEAKKMVMVLKERRGIVTGKSARKEYAAPAPKNNGTNPVVIVIEDDED